MKGNAIWQPSVDINTLKRMIPNTLAEHLGIEFLELGDDFLTARMPVDHRTAQPMGVLHGGASLALAETVTSAAAALTLDLKKQAPLGLEINASHLRSAAEGNVVAEASPVRVGRRTQVWDCRITLETTQKQICAARATIAIVELETLANGRNKPSLPQAQ